MIATLGIWVVKAGREDDFAHRWEESSSNLSLEFPNVTFRLLPATVTTRIGTSASGKAGATSSRSGPQATCLRFRTP